MSKKTDILVAGSGIAGLMAALAAARKGLRVRIVSQGAGCLAISGGSMDLLGYLDDKRVGDPWEAISQLPATHPYSLAGVDDIKDALADLASTLAAHGLEMNTVQDENGKPRNVLVPTIMGTFKPTYMYPAAQGIQALEKAQNILVLSVHGFRDCRARLVINQLRRYKAYASAEFSSFVLPSPYKDKGRSVSALDLAHFVDRPHGRDWFIEAIKGLGRKADVALIPPMLGARADSPLRKIVNENLGCPYVEMQTIPPGVQGMRVRDALLSELYKLNVEFFENAEVTGAEVKDGNCLKIFSHSTGRDITHEPKAVIVATGGILNGGVILSPGKANERIFGLNIPVPENVDEWTQADVFGKHLVSSLGVKVDSSMRPLDESGKVCLNNVFFAGRALGGYDFVKEKSGHGVAVATGWKAGRIAANLIQNKDVEKATGAAI